jgi:hypothetical protein
MSHFVKCIACNKPSAYKLTPDLDIRGIPVCGDCASDVKIDFQIFIAGGETGVKYWNDKYPDYKI